MEQSKKIEKQKVIISGEVLGDSGYTIHTKQLAVAMNEHFDVSINTIKTPGWETNCSEEIIKMVNKNYKEEILIKIGMPPFWNFELSENPKKFIGFLVWESDTIPKQWADICNDKRVDQIWVPSNFVKNACVESGVDKKKVFVVPHGVDFNKFYKRDKPIDLTEPFIFGFVKGWVQGESDRSNFSTLLRAFSEEFKKDEPVELLAKLNQSYIPPGWDLEEELKKLNIDLTNCPSVNIILENIPYAQLIGIYHKINVMVIPTKGEGFGLTMAESMACGLPVITTDFGGQTDFVNHDNGWILKTKRKPATDKNFIYEECYWGFCNVKDLRKVMREAFENSKLLKHKSKKSLLVIKYFSWKNAALKAKNALKHLKEEND